MVVVVVAVDNPNGILNGPEQIQCVGERRDGILLVSPAGVQIAKGVEGVGYEAHPLMLVHGDKERCGGAPTSRGSSVGGSAGSADVLVVAIPSCIGRGG